MLQGKYMTMMGPDEWSIMAGIKIPVAPWASSEYKSKESLARSKQREAELRINAMQIMFVQQIRESYIRYNNNLAKLEQVNREQVTTAENAWQAAQIAYGSGKADLTMSLDALRMALMAWDESIMAHMQVLQSILNIEKASGVSPGTWMKENWEHEGTSL
jgi:outer membrane protein TolC